VLYLCAFVDPYYYYGQRSDLFFFEDQKYNIYIVLLCTGIFRREECGQNQKFYDKLKKVSQRLDISTAVADGKCEMVGLYSMLCTVL